MKDEDQTVVREVLSGDKDKYARIVEKYNYEIFNLALKFLKDITESEDTTQEIFLKVFKNLKKYNFNFPFKHWLYSIAMNTIRDKLRKKKLMSFLFPRRIEESPMELINPLPGILEMGIKRERYEVILKSVDELPHKYKSVIILRYFQNFSYDEMSKVMGKPINSIKTLLFRAHKLLLEKLKGKI